MLDIDIDIGGRLVGDEDRRAVHQCLGHHEPPSHPT
jgi:hypothetical protein